MFLLCLKVHSGSFELPCRVLSCIIYDTGEFVVLELVSFRGEKHFKRGL